MDDPPPDPALTPHPNDGFFKETFSDPALAATFFRNHLPAVIAARIDWSTLELLPGSFVKTNLRQIHSDLLFSVMLGGEPALLYLLFEHQSTVDPAIPLRLHGSIGEILRRHQKAHGFPLPPVISFVLHQGPAEWTVPVAFHDQFAVPADLREHLLPFLPQFQYALLDLSQYDPASAEDDLQIRVVLQLMKLARTRQLLEYFRWLATAVTRQLPDNLLRKLLHYALHTDSNLDPEEIFRSLSENPDLQQRTMSVAEKLVARGRSEGISQGISQGSESAKAEWIPKAIVFGRIHTFQELLGQPLTPVEELKKLPEGQAEALWRKLQQEFERRPSRY